MDAASIIDDAPAAATPAQPRLGIAHLMIWTAGSAVILAVQRALAGWEGADEGFGAFMLVLAVPQCMVSGALLGCLAVGVSRRLQGVPFPVHPGQWLAILWGAATIGGWLSMVLFAVVNRMQDPVLPGYAALGALYGANALLNVLLAAGCVFVAIRGAFERRWTSVLIGMAVAELLSVGPGLLIVAIALGDAQNWLTWLMLAGNAFQAICGLVVAGIAFAAALGDRRRLIRRDWMHWVGVGALLWNFAVAWILGIVNAIALSLWT